jgi:L-ascorbate metabolism protein UlaG (beta-lactamase superfamily)
MMGDGKRPTRDLGVSAMKRTFAAFAVLLAVATYASAEEKQQPKIIWHGQSFFEVISSAGTRVILDPHAIEAYGRIEVDGDLILMSHLHTDHTQVDVVKDFKKVKQFNALKDAKGDGRRVEFVPINEKFKDVKFRDVASFHDPKGGLLRGRNGIWVIEMDGLHIVHLGDLGQILTEEQVKEIGPVDVLMIPVGGVYTIHGTDAKTVIEQLKPKRYILPMHYGTRVYDDLPTLDEFLDGQKPTLIKNFDRTNELTIDPTAEPPPEPLIAILHWEKK